GSPLLLDSHVDRWIRRCTPTLGFWGKSLFSCVFSGVAAASRPRSRTPCECPSTTRRTPLWRTQQCYRSHISSQDLVVRCFANGSWKVLDQPTSRVCRATAEVSVSEATWSTITRNADASSDAERKVSRNCGSSASGAYLHRALTRSVTMLRSSTW